MRQVLPRLCSGALLIAVGIVSAYYCMVAVALSVPDFPWDDSVPVSPADLAAADRFHSAAGWFGMVVFFSCAGACVTGLALVAQSYVLPWRHSSVRTAAAGASLGLVALGLATYAWTGLSGGGLFS
jgi:hypothetical protein